MEDVLTDNAWLTAVLANVKTSADSPEVQRLRSMLEACAEAFARLRSDVESASLVEPRRGLRDDEARSFLRAMDHGIAQVDAAGYVTLQGVRPKRPTGRYALLSKSGAGVSINLEYVVQIGATAELVLDHGWPGNDVDFERGEFDALAYDPGGRPRLAMEAKARATGPDSLAKLVMAWRSLARDADADINSNAGRKWRELSRLCAAGPMTVWLVSDGARWTLLARRIMNGGLRLLAAESPDRANVLSLHDS